MTVVDVGAVLRSSSTTEGRRAARGRAVLCREEEVDDARGSLEDEARLAAVVLRLRGIPEERVASESRRRRVDRVFSPSWSPGSRLTDPNSSVDSFWRADGATEEENVAASELPVSPGPPKELLLLKALFAMVDEAAGEGSRLLPVARGFGLAVTPIRPRRGIFVGVCDFGGGVPEGEGSCEVVRVSPAAAVDCREA